MKFPMLNVTDTDWYSEYDLTVYFLFDEFIYTDNNKKFNTYFKNKLFCDCTGVVYKITDKTLPSQLWRRIFKFLPNIYKITLTLEKTDKRFSIEEFSSFMIDRLNTQKNDDVINSWIKSVEQATNFEDIMGDIDTK